MKRSLLLKGRILVSCLIATTLLGTFILFEKSGFADTEEVGTAKEYTSPDLYVEFGDLDIDWKKGIEYDTDKYVLDVADKNEAHAHSYQRTGTYQVEYRLRLKEEADKITYDAEQKALEDYRDTLEVFAKEYPEEVDLTPFYKETVDIEGISEEELILEVDQEGNQDETDRNLEETEETEEADNQEISEEKAQAIKYVEELVEVEISDLSDEEMIQLLITHELYEMYLQHLEDIEQQAIENSRTNEVGSIYFYRDVIIEEPYEVEELVVTAGEKNDLYAGLTYDKKLYEIDIVNLEEYNNDVPGQYGLVYTMTKENGAQLSFLRYIEVLEVENKVSDKEDSGNAIATINNDVSMIAEAIPTTNTITRSGSYFREISGSSTAYISISSTASNVTLYLSGTGSIGGLTLTSSLQSLTIWVEEGSNISMLPAYSASTTPRAAIYGGTNAKIFILGPGNLTITGGRATAGGTYALSSNGTSNITQGTGSAGLGAAAAISTGKSVSVYSTGNNIEIIGGNGGAGGSGSTARIQRYSNTSYAASGPGGGGGGYFALALGSNAGNGSAGTSGQSYTVRNGFYDQSTLTAKKAGNGGAGSLGGGGGGGAIVQDWTYSINAFGSGGTGGSGGSVNVSTGAVTNGSNGNKSSDRYGQYNGNFIFSAPSGGTGGTSQGLSNSYNTVHPIVYHYNGSTLANPRGSSGSIYGGTTNVGSLTVNQTGTDNIFHGFSNSLTNMENGINNIVDVIAETPSVLGVSYNPAPPIDLDYYYIDPIGIASALIWFDPDYTGRAQGTTAYELPDGYSIIGYNVRAYVNDTNMTSNPDTKYYTVAEVATNIPGKLQLPEFDAVDNVSYWSVSLIVQKGSAKLESPTTVIQLDPPVVSAVRENDPDHGRAFMSLTRALEYIVEDDMVGTKDAPAEYRLVYLDNYNHNLAERNPVNTDREALENFSQGNTHLIFESDVKTETDDSMTNRYLLTATDFCLPRDDLSIDTDDNITVSFRTFRLTTENIVSYASDLTILEENLISVTNIYSVEPDEYTNGEDIITTTAGKYIDIRSSQDITNIYLDNDKYAPSLILGSFEKSETEDEVEFDLVDLTGAKSLELRENTNVSVLTNLVLPYEGTPLNSDRNGHVIFNRNTELDILGDSLTNSVGYLVVDSENAKLNFTETFDISEEAPLKVMGEAQIGENGLQVEIDGAYQEKEEWRGKDVIQFTSLDKLVVNDYWSSRLYYDKDEETCSLEVYDYRDMKIEVTFPNSTKIKFPSYQEAMEYIQDDYTGTNGTYTIALIDNYERLGLGGDGLNSNDNRALKNFYKASATLIFTTTTDEETGEYYTFVEAPEDYESQEAYGGYNDTFCLPSNPLRGTMVVTLQNIDFAFIENIYAGNILLNLYETVVSDNPITYHGTYDMSEVSGTNQSRMVIPASNTIGLDKDGEIQGVSFKGFATLTHNASSIIYANEVKKAENYATTFTRLASSEIHYEQAGIYEWGTITHSSTLIKSYFNHKEAIVYSYGTGLTHTTATWYNYIYFDDPLNAINRDLYVFFTAAGVPTTSYAKIASHSLDTALTNMVAIEARDNVITTRSYVATIAPDVEIVEGDETTYGNQVNYYKSLTTAIAGVTADNRKGEYEIIFTSDYQILAADNTALMNFYRADVGFDFSSKHREEIYIENIQYEPIVEESEDETEEDETEEIVDPYEGYNLVGLVADASYGYEVIILPSTYATPCYFNDIVFKMALDTRAALIRGGGGGVTVDSNIRATNVTEAYPNGMIDVSGYSQTSVANFNRLYQDPYVRVLGGQYRNIYGAREYATSITSTATTAGVTPKVYLEDGVVANLYGGSYANVFRRTTEIHISGGQVTDMLYVSNVGNGLGKLYLYGDHVLPYTKDYDYIYIEDGSTIAMNGLLTRNLTSSGAPYGEIHFGTDSQLQLYEVPVGSATSVINTAGQLITEGVGASLVMPKMGNNMQPLTLDLVSRATNAENGLLTVIPAPGNEYKAPVYVQDEEGNWEVEAEEEDEDAKTRFAVGDYVLRFSATTGYGADITPYNNGFFPLGLIGASPSAGYISLGAMPITMAKNDGEHEYYTSIAAACEEINRDGAEVAGETDYTIIFRQEGYTISTADATAMANYAKNAKSLTFTSAFRLTERDTLGAGEKVGDSVRRLIYISGNLSCYTNTYFDNILVEITTANPNIYAHGFGLYMGTNKAPYLPQGVQSGKVEIVGTNFPNVYGGNATVNVAVASTHVELVSGNYNNVYGGAYFGRVTGDAYLQIGGHTNSATYSVGDVLITGDVYGAGFASGTTRMSGYVGGNVDLIIYGATFTKTNLIFVGGGYSTSANAGNCYVAGDVNMEIWDAYAPDSDVTISGTYFSNANGNVTITVPEGGNNPVAKSASIYGTTSTHASTGGYIAKDFTVNIHSGEGLTLIKENKNTRTNKPILGEINIYMGAGGAGGGIGGVNAVVLELDTIDQFDNLYIGYNKIIEEEDDSENTSVSESGAARVTIGTMLNGITTRTNNVTTNARNGTIHMMEGSSLTLPTTGTVKAYNLTVDESLPHLYIGKENVDSATNPLILNGNNLSVNILGDGDEVESSLLNRLIIGLQSHEHNSMEEGELAEVGDNLIQFAVTPANAREYDYVSGVDKFDIVVSPTENGVIEYGASTLPIINQTLVEHKDADGNVTAPAKGINASINLNLDNELNTIRKTLHFTFENEDEDGDYSGFEIDGAYIANTGVKNTAWGEGGTLPSGVTEVEITESETEGLWYGKVTLDIESYGINQTAYYAHVRDERGSVKVICLDVHSPIYTNEPLVEQVDGGDYHITLAMTDPTYQELAGSDGEVHPYNAAGIYQGAYTIGTTEGCPGQDEILENRTMVLSENVLDVMDIHSSSTYFNGTAVVPKELLEGLDMEDTVIYMYLKDNLGNTRQVVIPMSRYTIDVSIPTRVGIVAVADTENSLLAPQCFVVNNGNNKVKAEVVGTDIGESNTIEFVTGSEQLGKNKMYLVISSDYRPYDYMLDFSYVPIEYLSQTTVHIGNMSPAVDEENAAYYTFAALYGANDLDVTGDWNLFTMKYRFTVLTE